MPTNFLHMNPGHVFDQVPRNKWKNHETDQCPKCKEPRFTIIPTAKGKPILQPYKWYIDFNLREQYLDLKFTRPDAPIQRSMEVGSFFASNEAERLRKWAYESGDYADAPRQGLHPDIGTFEIGLDWLEPWNSVSYSVGLVIVRDCDVEDRNLGKNENWRPLAICPGKKMPKNFQPYMIRSCRQARDLADKGVEIQEKLIPISPPTMVVPTCPAANPPPPPGEDAGPANQPPPPGEDAGPAASPTVEYRRGPWLPANSQAGNEVRLFTHRALLIGILADTPARYVFIYGTVVYTLLYIYIVMQYLPAGLSCLYGWELEPTWLVDGAYSKEHSVEMKSTSMEMGKRGAALCTTRDTLNQFFKAISG